MEQEVSVEIEYEIEESDGNGQSAQYLSIDEAKALKSADKETYLNDDDFQSVFGMEKQSFYGLAKWRQKALKKTAGFFWSGFVVEL